MLMGCWMGEKRLRNLLGFYYGGQWMRAKEGGERGGRDGIGGVGHYLDDSKMNNTLYLDTLHM